MVRSEGAWSATIMRTLVRRSVTRRTSESLDSARIIESKEGAPCVDALRIKRRRLWSTSRWRLGTHSRLVIACERFKKLGCGQHRAAALACVAKNGTITRDNCEPARRGALINEMRDHFVGGLACTRIPQRDPSDRSCRAIAARSIAYKTNCVAPITTVRDELRKPFLIDPCDIRWQNASHMQNVVGIEENGHVAGVVSHECPMRGPACISRRNVVQ